MMRHWRGVAMFICLLYATFAAARLAHAQAASDEDIFGIFDEQEKTISSATKSTLRANETPAIVTVITREELDETGAYSVADALKHVLGFYVSDDQILPNVGVRGVSGGLFSESGIIKVMIDGQSVAFHTTAGNWLGPELIPMSAIERIEIIRGPASALYGADAFLGVINIITRSGENVGGADIRGGAGFSGSHLSYDTDFTLGNKIDKLDILVSGRINQEDRSGLPLPSTSPAPNVADYHRGPLFAQGLVLTSEVGLAKLTYNFSEKSSLGITGRLASIDRGAEFAPWQQLSYGRDAHGRLDQTLVSLYEAYGAINGTFSLTEALVLDLSSQVFNGGPTSRDQIEVGSDIFYAKRHFGYIGTESSLELHWRTLPNLQTVAGASFVYDREETISSAHYLKYDIGALHADEALTAPAGGNLPPFINPGAYLQALWTPFGRYLTAIAGVRYDYHSIYGNQLSGRIGAVSQPIDTLHIKLLYGNAFKAPSPFLLYATPLSVGDLIGNPHLAPQTVHTFELELNWQPAKFFAVTTSVSYNILLNLAEFEPEGINEVARNVANVNSLSWETRADAHYQDWVKGYVSAEVNATSRASQQVGYTAQLVASQNFVYPPWIFRAGATTRAVPVLPLQLNVEALFVGPRPASESNTLAAIVPYDLPAYVLLNASLSTIGLHIFSRLDTIFSLTARNILGSGGPDPGFAGVDYPLAPRTVMLLVRQAL